MKKGNIFIIKAIVIPLIRNIFDLRCYHSSSEGGLNNFIALKLIWCTWGWGLLLTNRQITDNHLKEPSVAEPFFNATFSLLQYSSMSREGEHFHN